MDLLSGAAEPILIADIETRARRPDVADPTRLLKVESVTVSDDINVLALVKGQERYIFLYDDKNRSQALRVLGRYASNPELSFTWYDAAVLSQKIRRSPPTNSPTARFKLPQTSENIWHEDQGS